jgi:hypothetical protein
LLLIGFRLEGVHKSIKFSGKEQQKTGNFEEIAGF